MTVSYRLLLGILVALILITAGCSESPGDNSAKVPPLPPDGDYDCSDFDYQGQAKMVLIDSRPGDKYDLDNDSDGVPCESLPKSPTGKA